MVERVTALAASLGGREENEALRTACAAAVAELTGRLRSGVTPEDCEDVFLLAATWLALAGLAVGDADGGVEKFTAGEVSIQRADARQRGETLRLQAAEVMRPYLKDEGFAFRGVPG